MARIENRGQLSIYLAPDDKLFLRRVAAERRVPMQVLVLELLQKPIEKLRKETK